MVPISRVLPPIWTEEEFLKQVNQLPRPITPETVDEYNRLRALGRRRGFAWPYRVYVDPARRANPVAADVMSYASDGQPPIEGLDTRPIQEIDYEIAQINALMHTKGLIERIGNWDYFARQGYLYRGYKTMQIDRAGYRDQAERCAPLDQAEAILRLAREDRYFGPE